MSRRAASAAGILGFAFLLLALSLLPYRGYATPEVTVTIPPGAGAGRVAALLGDAGVIRSPALFRWAVRLLGSGSRLQAGEYRFDAAIGPIGVHRRLTRGDVLLHRLTIPEGLRLQEILDLVAGAGLGDRSDLAAAARDPDLLRRADPAAGDLEGYLFPDTYQLPRGLSARDTLRRMLDRFAEVVGPRERARAKEIGLSLHQLVTLASLVEKETAAAGERPMIASVLHNRVRLGMMLQCDPTVIYALVRAGEYDGRLTREALAFDSPYNTYRYAGLPPGPICSPGEQAIRAVLQRAETDYLYFVSRNDGTHEFSSRLQEHERAVDRYQRRPR